MNTIKSKVVSCIYNGPYLILVSESGHEVNSFCPSENACEVYGKEIEFEVNENGAFDLEIY